MTLTYKEQFNKKHGFPKETPHSLQEIAKVSGYKLSGIKIIFNKGVGAARTNPSSLRPHIKSEEEWAYARVYAAVNPKSKAAVVDAPHLIKL
jgi:hypothetical protein